ncbi:unnamed protein product [Caenorhabditis brenneri]
MSAMNTNNQEDLPPSNTANFARDDPEAFVASANHLVVHMGGSRNTSPPTSSGTSSSGPSTSTTFPSTQASNNATLPHASPGGINRQSTSHIGLLLDQPPQNRAILDEDAELDLEVELILSSGSKKGPIQSFYHPSLWPQASKSALPTSSMNQQQHSVYRPEFAQYPNHSSCQPSRHPQPHTSAALPPFSVYLPNVAQCSTDYPSRQPQPATHSSLPQSSGDQFRGHISAFWEWAKVKTFEEAMEDIEKNQKNKVVGRELTKEEKLWNKAVLHTLENKEIYFNRHLAGKPPNWDRYLFPSSLFNPFGEHAKMPQVVTKPPRPYNVFKRAQKLVGADKFPGNKETRKQCEEWAKMLKREHNLQIGLGFIVPRQMRVMKKRQVKGAVQMDYGLEDMDFDNDDELSRKIVGMAGSYGDNNNDNNGEFDLPLLESRMLPANGQAIQPNEAPVDRTAAIYAELAALEAQEKADDAETTRLLVENNDASRRKKEIEEKAVNEEKSRQERLKEGYKESERKGTKRKLETAEKDKESLGKCTPFEEERAKTVEILKREKIQTPPAPVPAIISRQDAYQLAEKMKHEIAGLPDLSPWLFHTSSICSVPQIKVQVTTAPDVYDTYVKTQNKKTTWEELSNRRKGQWMYNSQRIKAFQETEVKAGLICVIPKEIFEKEI